jgi:hypothetical protein
MDGLTGFAGLPASSPLLLPGTSSSVHPCGGHLEYLRPEELVGNILLVLEGTSGLCEIVDVTFEVYALHGL